MLSFLQRELPASGRVLYPGAIPPPLDRLSALREPAICVPTTPAADQVWAADVSHPSWGRAQIACIRGVDPVPEPIIAHTLALSDDEKTRARMGRAAVTVRVQAQQRHVLRDRKRLLFWLRALMQDDGVVAIDVGSTMLWSQAMLDDELAHDAALDIESLYAIHAVQAAQDETRVSWLHTHGLEELRAFDIRAAQTIGVFRSLMEEFASLELPALVKLGYEVDGGGPTDREHLWFTVHQVLGDKWTPRSRTRRIRCPA